MPTNPTSGKMCWKHGWMEFAEAYAQHRLDIFPNPSPKARRERPQPVEIVGNHWIHRDHSDSDAQFYRREEVDRLLDSLEAELAALKAQPDGWIAAMRPAVVTSDAGVVEGIFTTYEAALSWATQHRMGVANVRGGAPFHDVQFPLPTPPVREKEGRE